MVWCMYLCFFAFEMEEALFKYNLYVKLSHLSLDIGSHHLLVHKFGWSWTLNFVTFSLFYGKGR